MTLHDMPDLPARAFQRVGRNILPQGSKGSAPETPDYAAAAEQTAAGNLENARYATQANRPNQITPWGNITWDNGSSFDQSGYNAAMDAYNQGMASGQNPQGGSWQRQRTGSESFGDSGSTPIWGDVWVPNGPGSAGGATGGGTMPTRDQFTNPGGDNWTSTVTLSPEMQAMLDQQNKLQMGMFGAQDQALGRVNEMMGQGFDMSGMPAWGQAYNQANAPGYGQVLNQNSLPGFGQVMNMDSMPGYGQVLDQNSLPGYGQVLDMNAMPGFGSVLDPSSLPQAGNAFNPTGQSLDVYDPNANTNNAAELLMSRMNPDLDRQQEALRGQLANQGVTPGSAAYNQAMTQFGQQRNDANTQAQLQGIGLGMQQQGLQFNQGLQNRGLLSSEQNQQFTQQGYLRDQAAALQGQQYGQQNQNQSLYGQLQAQQYGQQNQNQTLAGQLQAQQYGQQNQNQTLAGQLQAQQYGQQNQNQTLAAALQNQQFAQQNQNQGMYGQLQNQQFNQQNQARQQQMQEQAYLRNLPMNELNALRTGNQVGMPQFGGFSQQATTGGTDYMGAAQNQYQANLAQSNADAAGQSGMMGGLMGIGGGILGGMYGGPQGAMAGGSIGSSMGGMFSDRRLKRNIKQIGKADNGLNIYSYNYVWGGPAQIGFMADEVQKISPHAVGQAGGYLTVDYARA